MIASKTNVAPFSTVTITPESSLQEPSVITDGDYSSVYTDTLDGQVVISFSFSSPQDIDYIAIGGSNISTKDRIKIVSTDASNSSKLYDSNGASLFDSLGASLYAFSDSSIDDGELGLSKSKVMMYRPKIKSSAKIEITVFGYGGISISDIAMGEEYEILGGEQAGYVRPWTAANIKTRSSVGLDSSPISLTYESRENKSQLVIPNNLMSKIEEYREFTDFISSNTFYILEDDDKFHSYACFNADVKYTTASNQSRALGRSVISYSTYSEASETFL